MKVNRFVLNLLVWICSKKRLRSIRKCNARTRRRRKRRRRRSCSTILRINLVWYRTVAI